MSDQWIETVERKIGELELIASWASIVGYGMVRDHCRIAIYDLKYQVDHTREQERLGREFVKSYQPGDAK